MTISHQLHVRWKTGEGKVTPHLFPKLGAIFTGGFKENLKDFRKDFFGLLNTQPYC